MKYSVLRILIAFVLLLLLCIDHAVAGGGQQHDKLKLIDQLLTSQKAEQNAIAMADQFIALVKKHKPNVPESEWSRLKLMIDHKKFSERLVPVYDKYYNEDQLNALIKYYQNPKGNPPVKPSPEMEKEIYNVSNEYGKETGKFLSDELKKRGY